jgi:hypothetical protein
VELPVGDRSPINRHAETVELGNIVELSRAIFELGFFTEDLSRKGGDSVEKGDSEHRVYVGHLWEERHKERTTEVTLSDLTIPCYAGGEH